MWIDTIEGIRATRNEDLIRILGITSSAGPLETDVDLPRTMDA